MPRPLREEVENGVFHVFARGNCKQPVYLDDADRETYLRLLGRTVKRQRWTCLAYCLMENHVHLLVETPHADLGRGMQVLHGLYAQTFNERHGRVGHLFQGRYGAVRVLSDEQLWAVARYIARNPLEAGLCGRAEEWVWSSHPAALGLREAPPWLDVRRLLSCFAAAGGDGRRRYLAFVGVSRVEGRDHG